MPRYIDADALKYKIEQHSYPLSDRINSIENGMFLCGIYQAIDESITADAVPVVRGEWIDSPTGDYAICSYCHVEWNVFDNDTYRFQHCPACGAKMDGERRESEVTP